MPPIADAFSNYFRGFDVELPSGPLEAGDSGHIRSRDGWDVRYVVGSDEDGIYLDFYAVHRMTNPQHVRIHADGTVEPLPSPQDAVHLPCRCDRRGAPGGPSGTRRPQPRRDRRTAAQGADRQSLIDRQLLNNPFSDERLMG